MGKKRNLKSWLVMAVFLLVMVGTTFAEPLWPLEVGQKYVYNRSTSDPCNNQWIVLLEVDGQMTENSFDYFHIQAWNYNNDSSCDDWGYIRSTDTGIYCYNPSGPDYLEHQKAPVGTKWSFYQEDDSEYNYKVIEINDVNEVNVPYGTFDESYKTCRYQCVDPNDVNESNKSPNWYEWVVPGTGWVKQEDWWVDYNAPWIMELIRSPISDHLYSIGIHQGWDYGYPNDACDFVYEFTFRIQTDPNVELVEFNSPAGNTFQIPKIVEQCSENICTYYECEDETCHWEYHAEFSNEANLADYGDGTYNITVYYQGDTNDQTTAWFGILATSDPIPQITQEPNLIFPEHNGTTTSPVTLTWEPCTDPNVNVIVLALENYETGEETYNAFPPDANNWDNVELSPCLWEVDLSFGQRYPPVPNNDGILVGVSKYSESDYLFTVTNPADLNKNCTVNFQDFAIFALAWLTEPGEPQWNPICDISIPADNSIDTMDLKVFTDNWLAGVSN